jgi:hypothetical protein
MNGARPVAVPTVLATCDLCAKEFPAAERVYICTPRPSDPSEIVCILYACPVCQPPKPGTLIGTREMLDAFILTPEAERQGYRWLTI